MSKIANKLKLIGYSDLGDYLDILEKLNIDIERIWSKLSYYLYTNNYKDIPMDENIIVIRHEILDYHKDKDKVETLLLLSLIDALARGKYKSINTFGCSAVANYIVGEVIIKNSERGNLCTKTVDCIRKKGVNGCRLQYEKNDVRLIHNGKVIKERKIFDNGESLKVGFDVYNDIKIKMRFISNHSNEIEEWRYKVEFDNEQLEVVNAYKFIEKLIINKTNNIALINLSGKVNKLQFVSVMTRMVQTRILELYMLYCNENISFKELLTEFKDTSSEYWDRKFREITKQKG